MEEQKLQPTILFIFGGSGDLTNRKLIPALYNLFLDNYLPEIFVRLLEELYLKEHSPQDNS